MNLDVDGFVDPKVEVFVKLGGSVFSDQRASKKLARIFVEMAEHHHRRLVVFPGGGPVDEWIESYDRKTPLKSRVHHEACARAQDQTGLLFSNFEDGIEPITDFGNLKELLDSSFVPIVLASELTFKLNPFEKSWKITSDSMGAYFAHLLCAKQYLLLKDVDGVFDGDPKLGTSRLFRRISARSLMRLRTSAVDSVLPGFIMRNGINCWIINGLRPDRVRAFLRGRPTIMTEIMPDDDNEESVTEYER